MIGGDERELPAKHSLQCNFPPRFQVDFAASCPCKESVAVLRFRIQLIALGQQVGFGTRQHRTFVGFIPGFDRPFRHAVFEPVVLLKGIQHLNTRRHTPEEAHGVQYHHHMTPQTEGSGHLINVGFPRYSRGNQKLRNEVANLP